jgi:3-deoxy-D-manno-octulosonate 8-phosphate phosphatase (KDO 8-P phosphatase)
MLELSHIEQKASKIKMIVFDVDGVLTDGRIIYTSSGDEIKFFNVKDGLGISTAIKKGLIACIITARTSAAVQIRAKELNIQHLFQGVKDKRAILEQAALENQIQLDEVFYMGDDLPDIPALKIAGLSCCPSDASDEVKSICHWITHKAGGHGAAREATDLILKQFSEKRIR